MLMFISIDSSCTKFCKPFSVGVRPKVYSGSYSECCVTVMRSNLKDKIVRRVEFQITLQLEWFAHRWKRTLKRL